MSFNWLDRVGSFASAVILALALVIFPWSAALAEDQDADQGNTPATRVIPRGPGEVPARIEADARPKDVSFDFPGVDQFLQPWTDWKSDLAENQKLRLGLDYQPVAQWSNNDIGEDSAAGGIFRAFSTWDMWGKDQPSRTGTLDVRVEHRHKIGTDLPPESLAPNFGWLGTTAPDWSDQDLGLPILMLRQRLDAGEAPIELRVGYMSAFSQFDITPYSDNLTTFMNNSLILNPTIAYPSAGSFGVGGYVGIPGSKFYTLGMIMDANGEYDNLDINAFSDDEYFKAIEFGWTEQEQSGMMYLFNNFHATLWENDKGGWGATATGSYTFWERKLGFFGRLGWASDDTISLYRRTISGGATLGIYRDSMIGIGASWGQAPGSNEDQVATELFYKWQMAQNLALTPSIQLLANPALNPDDDLVTVIGLRLRLTL